MHDDDVPPLGIMRLAEQGGAFDFWTEAGEDIYCAEDGEPVCHLYHLLGVMWS
jgi:hypothetical protein